MNSEQAAAEQAEASPKRRKLRKRAALLVALLLLGYLLAAYILLPIDWRWYVRRHRSLDDISGITLTRNGIPGDPLTFTT